MHRGQQANLAFASCSTVTGDDYVYRTNISAL